MNWKSWKHLSYFRGKNYFENDGTQNYLVFQPMYKYFKITPTNSTILSWKSKGLSDETIKPFRRHTVLTSELSHVGNKTRVQFNGSCLKQNKVTFNPGKIVNIYIVYEIILYNSNSNYPTLENCLFRALRMTKNADTDRYGYSGYGIAFDWHESFSFPGNGLQRNIIIFGVEMSSS